MNGGFLAKVGKGAFTEGLMEEAPQSTSETAFTNSIYDRPIGEGVADSAIEGGIIGGVMGAAMGGGEHFTQRNQPDGTSPLGEQILKDEASVDSATMSSSNNDEIDDHLGDLNTRVQSILNPASAQNPIQQIAQTNTIDEAIGAFNNSVVIPKLDASVVSALPSTNPVLNDETTIELPQTETKYPTKLDDSQESIALLDQFLSNGAILKGRFLIHDNKQVTALTKTQKDLAEELLKNESDISNAVLPITEPTLNPNVSDNAPVGETQTETPLQSERLGEILTNQDTGVTSIIENPQQVVVENAASLPQELGNLPKEEGYELAPVTANDGELFKSEQAAGAYLTAPINKILHKISPDTHEIKPVGNEFAIFKKQDSKLSLSQPVLDITPSESIDSTPSTPEKLDVNLDDAPVSYDTLEGLLKRPSDNAPFKDEKSAHTRFKLQKLSDEDYAVVPVKDGYAIAPIKAMDYQQFKALPDNAPFSDDVIKQSFEALTGKVAPVQSAKNAQSNLSNNSSSSEIPNNSTIESNNSEIPNSSASESGEISPVESQNNEMDLVDNLTPIEQPLTGAARIRANGEKRRQERLQRDAEIGVEPVMKTEPEKTLESEHGVNPFYKNAAIADIEAELPKMQKRADKLALQGAGQMSPSGNRSTSKAVASEGARKLYDEIQRLNGYVEARKNSEYVQKIPENVHVNDDLSKKSENLNTSTPSSAGVENAGREDGIKFSRAQSQNDFVQAPDGSFDFGEITPEIAKAIGRQSAKIKLQYGEENDVERFGLVHIEAGHKQEIEATGLSIEDFVYRITSNPDTIRKAGSGSLLLEKEILGKDSTTSVSIVKLTPDETGDFYNVETAFVIRNSRLDKKYPLLWEKSETTPSTIGDKTPFATLSSIKADEERPSGTLRQSNLSENIPQAYTKSTLETALRQIMDGEYGNGWFDGLLGTGKFKIISSEDAKAFTDESGIQAFYNESDETTYFIHDGIDKDTDLKGLMLHELGVHALKAGKDTEGFNQLLKSVNALVKTKNTKAVEAHQAAKDAGTNEADMLEETAAYLVEKYPNLPISQKIIAWFKNAIRELASYFKGADKLRFVQWANNLNENDIVFMASQALKRAPDELVFDSGEQEKSSNDIHFSKSFEKNTPQRIHVSDKIKNLLSDFENGSITNEQLTHELSKLHNELESKNNAHVRGANSIRKELHKAKRRGDISDDAADLAEWFILQNEALVDDLGISLKSSNQSESKGSAGYYNPISRILTLIKGSAKDSTAVHEMLHHLERLMPEDLQAGIRNEWLKQTLSEHKKATDLHADYFEAALSGNQQRALKILSKIGDKNQKLYRFINASEFWAVNSTDILQNRFHAKSSAIGRVKQWLREFIQYAKKTFGFASHSPLLETLDYLLNQSHGEKQANSMLSQRNGHLFADKIDFEDTKGKPTQDDYLKNRVYTRNYKARISSVLKGFGNEISDGIDNYLGSSRTRLENISKVLSGALVKLEYDINSHQAADIKAVLPFLEKMKTMAKTDYADMDYALKNGDTAKINLLIGQYNLHNEYAALRETLDKLRDEANDVGLSIGKIESYFPRVMNDTQGFLNAIGKGDKFAIFTRKINEEARKQDLKPSELSKSMKADLIANMIEFQNTGLAGLRSSKSRKLEKIPPELNEFYMDSPAALLSHIHSMRKHIEYRKMLGHVPKKVAEIKSLLHKTQVGIEQFNNKMDEALNDEQKEEARKSRNELFGISKQLEAYLEKYVMQRDYTQNIHTYIMQLVVDKQIPLDKEQEVFEILTARLHEHGTTGLVNAYQNFSYIDTMGSFSSAITQLGDYIWVLYEGGLLGGAKNIGKAISKKGALSNADFGIERIGQEFVDSSTLADAVNTVFKYTGLNKITGIASDAVLSTVLEKFQKQAKSQPDTLRTEIMPMFDKETDSVLQDLRDGTINDNVKMLVYSRYLDFYPASLSELPVKYLTAGNGRVFYTLKRFQIKFFDIVRREVFNEIRDGNTKTGLKNLGLIMMLFVAAGMGTDQLKDWLHGRNTDWDDLITDNLLKLMGVSKFITYQARTEGVGTAALKQILPPFSFINALGKDIIKADDINTHPKNEMWWQGLETLNSVPLVGKLTYWHMGRGQHKREELYEIRFKKEKQRLNEIKDELEQLDGEDYRRFYNKHVRELNRLKLVNKIQGQLSANKRQINFHSALKKSANRENSINKLNEQREKIMTEFLKG